MQLTPRIAELLERIRALEAELEKELAQRQEALRYRLEGQRIRFEEEVLAQHRRFRRGLLAYLAQTPLRHYASAPIIYGLLPLLAAFDFGVWLYQWLCFPLYRIPRVRRRDYFVFDREQLAYLNVIEKINCGYCSYANSLVAYSREVIARTEQYWCPIKHAKHVLGTHERYRRFADFGDAESYVQELERLRKELEANGKRGRPQ